MLKNNTWRTYPQIYLNADSYNEVTVVKTSTQEPKI